jgi:hypothetical protein
MLPVGVQYSHLSGHMRKLWLLVSKRSKTAWLSDSSACFAKQGQPKVSGVKRLVRYGRSFQVLVNLRVATYEPSQLWPFWFYSLKSSNLSRVLLSAGLQEILDAAYGVLVKEPQRRDYNAHMRRSRNNVLSVSREWLPGALILAQQVRMDQGATMWSSL